ncbi:MAG: FtsQ-type POTRA domain-containing protein [Candidatus Pacebacteria bacterium]|nr:FtsQ-type POTRA domain-containing protein [Candidatus Paceibacterota bacterium]
MTKYRKIKKKKSIFKNKLFWLILICFVLIISICYLLFLSPVFKIKDIKITGDLKYENINEIETKAWQMIPKNILFLQKGSIVDNLLKQYIVLDEVKIKKEFPNKIEISLEERKPVANFCNDKCWYVDEDGIAFKELGDKDEAYVVLISEKPEENIFPNVISKELLNSILLSKDEIKKLIGLNILECNFSNLKIELKTEQEWLAILDPKGNIKNQVSSLNLVFKNKIGEEDALKIDYIDVRLDKIFYMMK